jgi:ATP-dependent DNA helicase RecG
MTSAGNPVNPPTFEERQGFLVVTFKAAVVEAREKTSVAPVTAPVTTPVTAPVLRLLELLFSKGNLGNVEILASLGLKNRRRMRETYIAPAMHAALIEYTIPDKPRSSKQKYRLTAMGRKILEKEGLQ